MLPETQSESSSKSCNETISQKGFRFTAQRREVYDALLLKRDHPTAVDVFLRVQKKLPGISLATVYNCLETLAECGLVRAVNHDRQPSRYCAESRAARPFLLRAMRRGRRCPAQRRRE